MMHYYITFPFAYRPNLDEKNVNNWGSTLHICLEYEEKLHDTGIMIEYSINQSELSSIIQLMKDSSNEKKFVAQPHVEVATSSLVRNHSHAYHPNTLLC